ADRDAENAEHQPHAEKQRESDRREPEHALPLAGGRVGSHAGTLAVFRIKLVSWPRQEPQPVPACVAAESCGSVVQPLSLAVTSVESGPWWRSHPSGSATAGAAAAEHRTASRFPGSGSPRSNHCTSAAAASVLPIRSAPTSLPWRTISLR